MEQHIDEKKIEEVLTGNYDEAAEIIKDVDKTERLLQRLEKKLEKIPVAGKKLAYVPIMISLIRSYIKKEYEDIPLGSIIAIVATLMYVVSQFDLLPDFLPGGLGLADDAAAVALCIRMVGSDVEEYQQWRAITGRNI